MFTVEPKQTRAEIRDQQEMDAIARDLASAGYRPLLRSVLVTLAAAANMPEHSVSTSLFLNEDAGYRVRNPGSRSLVGEVFFRDNALLIVQPVGDRLQVWEVRRNDAASTCDRACTDVERAIRRRIDGRRVRGMQFSWKTAPLQQRPRTYPRHLFQEVKLETKKALYSAEELAGAQLLSDAGTRTILLRLSQLGKARTTDPALTADDKAMERLLSACLVRREFLVSCRQDSRTLVIVPDKESLAAIPKDMRCSVCGRAFDNELTHEIFSVSDLGRRLLSGSHWMTIWVTGLLRSAGVPESAIAWNAAAGQDELDIIVDTIGLRVFFELKDREFGLGDAYPFVARVNRYGGTHGIVITTERVAEEVRTFLNEQRQTGTSVSVTTIEGADKIPFALRDLVARLSRTAVTNVMRDLVSHIGLSIVQLVNAWMLQVEKLPVTALAPVSIPPTAVLPSVGSLEATSERNETASALSEPSSENGAT